jgi:hypothetical protein
MAKESIVRGMQGRVIAETVPARRTVKFNDTDYDIDFRLKK